MIKRYRNKIYPIDLTVVVEETISKGRDICIKNIYNRVGEKVILDNINYYTEAFEFLGYDKNLNKNVVITVTDKCNNGVIAHESLHGLIDIASNLGCNLIKDEEFSCYLLQYIVDCVNNTIKKYKEEKKKKCKITKVKIKS